MSLTPEQIEELRLAGSKWANQELRPKDPLNPGVATDPNARAPYPAESAWAWTLLPDQVDQVRDAINALLTGMLESIVTSVSLAQTLEGKEASGTAQSLVDALSDSVGQALEGKEASGTAQSLVDALSQAMAEALQDKEASGTAQDLVDALSQVITEALELKEASGTAQELFGSLGLNEIASTKDITPVDIFIYDTKNDSDGGLVAQRNDFPSLMILVAESDSVEILDADTVGQPLWKSIDFTGSAISAIAVKEGILVVGTATGLVVHNLITGDSKSHTTTSAPAIINDRVSSGAMTVLDYAPIDPATGLPVPTIAVATHGGASIINGPAGVGTVVNWTQTVYGTICCSVSFRCDGALCAVFDLNPLLRRFRHVLHKLPTSDIEGSHAYHKDVSDEFYPQYVNAGYLQTSIPISSKPSNYGKDFIGIGNVGLADASNYQLSLIHANPEEPTKGMLAAITSEYNTGWMVGDTKFCALCSTDTSDLVGSAELVRNGEQWVGAIANTAPNEWSKAGELTQYAVTEEGTLRVERNNEGGLNTQQSISTEAGKSYVISFDLIDDGGGNILVATTRPTTTRTFSGTGKKSFTFNADDDLTTIGFRGSSSSTQIIEIDNFSVLVADFDQSALQNGLIVNGAIERPPVAAGSDLVAYSGFSSDNYLEQPYNADLDFGAGDFSVMAWVKAGSTSTTTIVERSGLLDGFEFYKNTISANAYLSVRIGGQLVSATKGSISGDEWHHVMFKKESGIVSIYHNGGLVHEGANTGDVVPVPSPLFIGYSPSKPRVHELEGIALVKISGAAPSAEQIAKIYNDEKRMFKEGAQSTLYGSSDAVLAIDHDDITGTLHAGTSDGRSEFDGLVRVNNTTDSTSVISAHDGLVVEG